jgi:hypothetical protein
LLTASQLVVDIAGELSARRGDRFEDYTEAVRNASPRSSGRSRRRETLSVSPVLVRRPLLPAQRVAEDTRRRSDSACVIAR